MPAWLPKPAGPLDRSDRAPRGERLQRKPWLARQAVSQLPRFAAQKLLFDRNGIGFDHLAHWLRIERHGIGDAPP
jgi:hypothetical protein